MVERFTELARGLPGISTNVLTARLGEPTDDGVVQRTLAEGGEGVGARFRGFRNVDVLEAIKNRRSIGKVSGDVSDDQLSILVEAGLCAPNHKLTDPVRYIALRGEARRRLGDAWARDAVLIEPPAGVEKAAFVVKEAGKPMRAPVLLVVVHRVADDPVLAVEDAATAAAAVQNILLAAHGLGLGAIWRTGGMVRSAAVMDELELGPDERITGIVYLGEPAMPAPAASFRDVAGHLTTRS